VVEKQREAERNRLAGIETTPDISPIKDFGYSSLTVSEEQMGNIRNGLQELQELRDATAPGEVRELRREVEELKRELAASEDAKAEAEEKNGILNMTLQSCQEELTLYRKWKKKRTLENSQTMKELEITMQNCSREMQKNFEQSKNLLKRQRFYEISQFASLWARDSLSSKLPSNIEGSTMIWIPKDKDRLLGALWTLLLSSPHALALVEGCFQFDVNSTKMYDTRGEPVPVHCHFREFNPEIFGRICDAQRDYSDLTRPRWSCRLGGLFERHDKRNPGYKIWTIEDHRYCIVSAKELLRVLNKYKTQVYEEIIAMAIGDLANMDEETLLKGTLSTSRRLHLHIDRENRCVLTCNEESINPQSAPEVELWLRNTFKHAQQRERDEEDDWNWKAPIHLLLRTFLTTAVQDLIRLICYQNQDCSRR
jgi:hypothetical protein